MVSTKWDQLSGCQLIGLELGLKREIRMATFGFLLHDQ